MSIASEITRLSSAKADIKAAIERHDVSVPSSTKLDDYAPFIDAIGEERGVAAKDVNFFDYDGTILYAYTAAEFATLAAMPANPFHFYSGLTAQGWNWSLADAKAHVATYKKLNIGQMYIPADGKTKIFIRIYDVIRPMSLYLGNSEGNGVIEWGDGATTFVGIGGSLYTHEYTEPGDYVISLDASGGSWQQVYNSDVNICGSAASYHYNRSKIYKIFIGGGFYELFERMISGCFALTTITLPVTVRIIASGAFYNNFCLKHVTIPCIDGNMDIQQVGSDVFYACRALKTVSFPRIIWEDASLKTNLYNTCISLTSLSYTTNIRKIDDTVCQYCYSLTTIPIYPSVTSIGSKAFDGCTGVKHFYVYPTTPPSIQSNTFNGIPSDAIIYVPAESVDTYKAATNWSAHASKIQAMP